MIPLIFSIVFLSASFFFTPLWAEEGMWPSLKVSDIGEPFYCSTCNNQGIPVDMSVRTFIPADKTTDNKTSQTLCAGWCDHEEPVKSQPQGPDEEKSPRVGLYGLQWLVNWR